MSSALISPISIAPMLDWTNTHFRVFMRMIAPKILLYTEMQTVGAIIHNPARSLLYHPSESPLALQIGGSNKEDLVLCSKMAEDRGFDEINLNLGCPSHKVQAGSFGACLMAKPDLVAECIHAMKKAVATPITAKIRLGIDEEDSYTFFSKFAHKLIDSGCDKLIVHARKAWLRGLSPKQNRTVPPLHYDFVYQLKKEFANIPIVINGNIQNLDETKHHLNHVDGVMLGRLVCQDPFALATIHEHCYPDSPQGNRHAILKQYMSYVDEQFSQGVRLSVLFKPLYNAYHGLSGAKRWKEHLAHLQQTKNLKGLFNTESESFL